MMAASSQAERGIELQSRLGYRPYRPRLAGAHDHDLARDPLAPGVTRQHQQVQQRKQQQQRTGMAQIELTHQRARPRGNHVMRLPLFHDEACSDEHFGQAFFAEVFVDAVFFAVPGTEFRGGVFGNQAVDRDGQLSARLENAETFVDSGLRAAEMLEAAYTDDAVKRFVFEAEIFGKAVNVVRARTVQLLRGSQILRIGFESIGRFEMPREPFRPETVTASYIEQGAARGFFDPLAQQGKFAIPIERTIASDRGVQTMQ